MATATAAASDIPFLSFNTNITKSADVTLPPAAESAKKDPKLGASWTIWEQPTAAKGSTTYAGEVRPLVNFSTVKEFWGCWNHLPQPSQLFEGKRFVRMEKDKKQYISGWGVFRKGISPEWEDEANSSGGHLELQLKPELGPGLIDELWNNVVLGMVGDLIEPADMITGARLVDKLNVVKGKPVIRIELWFKDFDDEDNRFKLRGNFEKMLRTKLDGSEGVPSWGYTQLKQHKSY
eukprot:TRINITY_DN105370_c0_g1_i1.p1 TRINITY_DN105370_c0_g1~~TRINITY_DN105370_c0_g1_i1.p1  ORF type:complete len:235 (-),score=53.64 TRINITY_DN105370_c0_g1_i1:34-738(-)